MCLGVLGLHRRSLGLFDDDGAAFVLTRDRSALSAGADYACRADVLFHPSLP